MNELILPLITNPTLLYKDEVCLLFALIFHMQAYFVYRSGFFGTVVEYGAETKISRHSVLGATVSVGVPQGVSLKIKYETEVYNNKNKLFKSFLSACV